MGNLVYITPLVEEQDSQALKEGWRRIEKAEGPAAALDIIELPYPLAPRHLGRYPASANARGDVRYRYAQIRLSSRASIAHLSDAQFPRRPMLIDDLKRLAPGQFAEVYCPNAGFAQAEPANEEWHSIQTVERHEKNPSRFSRSWSDKEIDLAVRKHAIGGIQAAMEALPHRSRAAIETQLSRLKVTPSALDGDWQEDEIDTLRTAYTRKGITGALRALPNKSRRMITRQVALLRLRRQTDGAGALWTAQDIEKLAALVAAKADNATLYAAFPDRTASAIQNCISVNGLAVKKPIRRLMWTPEEDAALRAMIADGAASKDMVLHFPERSASSVIQRVSKLKRQQADLDANAA